MTAEEEVQAGLMNAMERGVPIEKAIQTFINAGYSESSVRSAARAINEGNVSFPHIAEPIPQNTEQLPIPAQEKSSEPLVESPKLPDKEIKEKPVEKVAEKTEEKSDGVSKTKIIILVIVLVLLLGVLAASFLFKEQIASLFA